MKFLKLILQVLEPKSANEDKRRQEFILNIFTAAITTLIFIATVVSIVAYFFLSDAEGKANNMLSYAVLFILLSFFGSLLLLSRKGYVTLASNILIVAIFSFGAYMASLWGPDLPAAILMYVFTIVMAGVLISTRVAFVATAAIVLAISVIDMLQYQGVLSVNRYWAAKGWEAADIVVIAFEFFIIATVSWLSNREIEKSLIRARKSEAELKEERDTLEMRVVERTEELRKAEVEKMTQAYRFVEFGRLAGGIFHDLVNPLTALSLNIESIASRGKESPSVGALAEDVERAKQATMHMKSLMDSMRKHLEREGNREHFSLNGAIVDLVRVLEPYARKRSVQLRFNARDEMGMFGDAVHFSQVMTNLVSNAIESHDVSQGGDAEVRFVEIELERDGSDAQITVRDNGSGISAENLGKIFEPFFTTKNRKQGLGIGLSLAKRIVEKEFGGMLSVESAVGKGSSFVLKFPA